MGRQSLEHRPPHQSPGGFRPKRNPGEDSMRTGNGFTWFVLSFVFLLAAANSFAQQADSAIVVGSVLDSSKAAVTGATVTLTHVATNSITEVRTNERGEYRTPPLRLGEYAIGVEAPGF